MGPGGYVGSEEFLSAWDIVTRKSKATNCLEHWRPPCAFTSPGAVAAAVVVVVVVVVVVDFAAAAAVSVAVAVAADPGIIVFDTYMYCVHPA